jgi:hypothetical protein
VPSGYRLRKHIAQALQKRSSAIRTALDHYNTAALALNPPRPTLQWDEVVEYAFLSDFDLLRDSRQNIQHRPWATPAGRLAMDTHFKLLRAREELDRLNIEIRRVATHLRDEDHYLRTCEEAAHHTDPALAHQILIHRMLRGRFKTHHEYCLGRIAKMKGFAGTIVPGESLDTGDGASVFSAASQPPPASSNDEDASASMGSEAEELQRDAEDDEEDEQVHRDLLDVLQISLDGVRLGD